jgi:Flp pilus assembly protein TadG
MIRLLKRFLADRRGISAVEFALIAPVLIVFYFGTVELDSALAVNRKVTAAASAVADLVAQDNSLDNTEIAAIFTATEAIMAPYDPDDTIQVRVSSVRLNNQSQPVVVWSDAHNMTPRAVDSPVAVPPNVLVAGTTVVVAEVVFPYEAPLSDIMGGAIQMDETFYLRPRRGASVCRVNGASTVC